MATFLDSWGGFDSPSQTSKLTTTLALITGHGRGSKDRVLAEGNVLAVPELREELFGGREGSPEFYQKSLVGDHILLTSTEHQSL